MSWRVFKNPLSLFIGGITAVIMELAEPRVRTGVWEHTTFRLKSGPAAAQDRAARGGGAAKTSNDPVFVSRCWHRRSGDRMDRRRTVTPALRLQ